MKSGILALLGGVAAALGLAALNSKRLSLGAASGLTKLDLNSAPVEAFCIFGLDRDAADRIVENRPYRTKIELLERYIIPKADYDVIKRRIATDQSHKNDPIRVAS